ncbi:flavin reductase family protein [Auritidibacter ignavus]|uniref:flavin reductase family protein n=1 Tax=Auritidibacter ignavus TaxID=678932 RepID=UPI00109C0494|nr:flavin reductase family protein [Auritidibacter ignavus]
MTATSFDVFSELRADLTQDISPHNLRHALEQYPTGVVALAGYAQGVKEGLVATSFTVGVSVEPPLVSFAIQNHSRTWPRMREADHIGVSIMGSRQSHICAQLASRSKDRFAGLDLRYSERGSIFLQGAAQWLDTSVYAELPAGDHHIVLLEVHGLASSTQQTSPLVRHRRAFRDLKTAEGNE